VWLLSCNIAIYKILENVTWSWKGKGRVGGGGKEMPECSGGTGITYVESKTIDDVVLLLTSWLVRVFPALVL